jgi:GNAT superfamily N-acetyltransferase
MIIFKKYLLLEKTSEDYTVRFKDKDILVRWEDKDSKFGRMRIFDPEEKHTYREYGKDITDYKQIGLIELKYDPYLSSVKPDSKKTKPTTAFTSFAEYYKNKIIVGLVLIDSKYRRQGYSELLLTLAEQYTKDKGVEYMLVEYATPLMLNILKKKFPDIKYKKDSQTRGEFKELLIKI